MKSIFKTNTSLDSLKLNYKWNINTCDFTITNISDKEHKLGDTTLLTAKCHLHPTPHFTARAIICYHNMVVL